MYAYNLYFQLRKQQFKIACAYKLQKTNLISFVCYQPRTRKHNQINFFVNDEATSRHQEISLADNPLGNQTRIRDLQLQHARKHLCLYV